MTQKSQVSIVPVVLLALMCGAALAEPVVLTNLCSGPPADPLPPLRANRPSASEMAATPRRHPYLFFEADSRQALRDRAKAEPFRGLAERLRAHAEDCLTRTIPPAAMDLTGIPSFLPDGSYNPEWLRRSADKNTYYTQSYAVQEVIPTLAFAYQLTSDARFGRAGKEWLLSFAARPKLAETGRETDFGAGYMAFGLALGYDWLWDLLSEPDRVQVQQALTMLTKPIVVVAKDFLQRPDPDLHRAWFGNNHRTRTHGLCGLALLALLHDVPDAAGWLDAEIQLHRDRLFPSAWAPNGEHLDAWGHFRASLEDPIAFVVALQRMGGEDFFHDPHLEARFRAIPHYFLYGLEGRFDARAYLSSWSYNTAWMNAWASCYAWPALASHLKDPTAQWIATRDHGLNQGNEIFGYLFHDPEIKAAPPADPPGSVYWPYSGMVKMCSDWGPQGILIPFRCGPEIGKDNGDQNGFRLRAGGDSLLPRLPIAQRKPGQPVEFDWDLMTWNFGSPSQNVVLLEPDEIGDAAILDLTGKIPMKGGIQFAQYPPMKGKDYDKQWLSGPEIIKRGEMRVVHFDAALDYVCGEAHRAFAYLHPTLWLRHILFVKASHDGVPPYVLICDEMEADEQPRTFAWQLHPGAPYALQGHKLSIHGEHTELDVHLLWPPDGTIVEKQTPAPFLAERTGFIQWRTAVPGARCAYVAALFPRTKKDGGPVPSFRMIEAAGGWAVEVSTGAGTDVALFRSERSMSATVASFSTGGTAALLRKPKQGPQTAYVLGK
jgi:uncharacterized protein DUF4962